MKRNTEYKVMFGFWIAVATMNAMGFAFFAICGNASVQFLIDAFLCTLICTNYWELWHVKAPTIHVNVVCRRVTCDELEEGE